MTCSSPCELIKLRDKADICSPMRYRQGVFTDYVLSVDMVFLGLIDGADVSFSTSIVLQIWEAGETIVFETKNSIYWLVPIDIKVIPHLFVDA